MEKISMLAILYARDALLLDNGKHDSGPHVIP